MNNDDNVAQNNDDKSSATVGDILSAAREQQGFTQQQVADRLHLRLSSVQAIESDGIEKGVSPTFTKGYVRLYARLLGLNAEPLLKAFDKLHAQDTPTTKLQSFSKRVEREANDSRWNMVTYIIVLLVIGSVVVWWVDQSNFSFSEASNNDVSSNTEQSIGGQESSELSTQRSGESKVRPQLNSPAPVNSLVGELDDALANVQDSTSLTGGDAANSSQISGQATATSSQEQSAEDLREEQGVDSLAGVITQDSKLEQSAADIVEQVTNDAADYNELTAISDDAGALVPSLSSDILDEVNSDGSVDMVFTFSDDCWVSVKDAFDETIAIGVKVKGRVMQVSGVPPIKVILGAPQVVSIDFGGESVDMSRFAAGRSATFELPLNDD